MIESFRHKGLKRLYERGDRSGVNPDHVERIEMKGDRKGFHAVTVRANWRIVFRFENGTCQDVDLVDYH